MASILWEILRASHGMQSLSVLHCMLSYRDLCLLSTRLADKSENYWVWVTPKHYKCIVLSSSSSSLSFLWCPGHVRIYAHWCPFRGIAIGASSCMLREVYMASIPWESLRACHGMRSLCELFIVYHLREIFECCPPGLLTRVSSVFAVLVVSAVTISVRAASFLELINSTIFPWTIIGPWSAPWIPAGGLRPLGPSGERISNGDYRS